MYDIKKWPCILFWGAMFALYSFWTWTHQLNDFGGDSAVYLLTAQHWSFFGQTNVAAAQFASATSFPPLYPILLTVFSAGDAWLRAHLVTAFCGVAALFVLWRCLRIVEIPLVDSLVSVALIALVPGFYSQALYIHSEFLFLLFISICLYAVSRLEREGKVSFIVLASLSATAAYLTRNVGLSMVAALVVYVLLCRPKREWLIVLVLAVVPMLAWMQFGQPPGGGYLASWNERLGIVGSPSVTTILAEQFAALVDGYQQNFAGAGSTNIVAVALFSFGCIVAWIFRLWQRKLDALFLGAYFAILLVWPFPAERVRFILPVVPIIVVQLLLSIYAWKLPQVRRGSVIALRFAIAVLAIMILPSFVLTVQRHAEPMPPELEAYRQSPEWYGTGSRDERLAAISQYRRLQVGFEEVAANVPSQDCVYSIKPSLVSLFARRNSYRSPLPNSSLGKVLDPTAVQCRYVHMLPFASPTFSEPLYPLASWVGGMDIIHVTRLVESDGNSGVVGLLGKIK